ncbi:MAG TPA: DUF1427 family protein [Fimbriimonadaceae bacterium]|nr:DUF1427 family protein [Fimbriimonadaceae bacterium]HRJ33326.1 DUF1427 family protein [Fimbriimonadaceae bacterium]
MEWWKLALGFALAFAIGFGCRAAQLPVPAPPTLYGALLIVAITLGFAIADRVLPKSAPAVPVNSTQELP